MTKNKTTYPRPTRRLFVQLSCMTGRAVTVARLQSRYGDVHVPQPSEPRSCSPTSCAHRVWERSAHYPSHSVTNLREWRKSSRLRPSRQTAKNVSNRAFSSCDSPYPSQHGLHMIAAITKAAGEIEPAMSTKCADNTPSFRKIHCFSRSTYNTKKHIALENER